MRNAFRNIGRAFVLTLAVFYGTYFVSSLTTYLILKG